MQCNNSDDTSMTSTSSFSACPVVSDSGFPCGETTGLEIIDEFRKLYEARIENVDPQDKNSSEVKMKIMMEWIRNLDEQNTMLVKTVKELEEAACSRVRMLENKLKQTSSLLSENMTRYEQPSQESLHELSERIGSLENEETEMKNRIEFLQSDIRGLLELIRRGYKENDWSLDGIKFYEVNPCEIPIPCDWQEVGDGKNIILLKQQFQILAEKEKKSIEYQHELLQKVAHLSKKLQAKEELIQKHKCKFGVLKDHLKRHREVSEPEDDIVRMLDTVESALIEEGSTEEPVLVESSINVLQLQNELEDKSREINRLTNQIFHLEKENSEIREALNMEVTEKHDQTAALKEQIAILEDQYRHATMQLQFKDELIKEMRRETKQKTKTKETSPISPRKVRINTETCPQKVSWGEVYSEESINRSENQQDSALKSLATIKAIMEAENNALLDLKSQLVDIFNVINSEKNKGDSEDSNFNCSRAEKLRNGIEVLSKICLENSRGILQMEITLQDIREKNDRIRELEEEKHEVPPPEITRQQLNAMEEFRVCTVEAQAATEDLKEAMDSVIVNLQCRNDLFVGLSCNLEGTQDCVAKTRESISNVIKCLKRHLEERVINKKTIAKSQSKLKEMKNDINEAILKLSCSTSSSDQNDGKEISNVERDNCDSLLNKVVEEIEYIVCNMGLFVSKDDDTYSLLTKLEEQLCQVEESIDDLQEKTDKILQDNQTAQKLFGEKSKRLDKFESELDYAHTRMQDNLENIVFLDQQNESFASRNDPMSSTHRSDENPQRSLEMDQLKNALCSKDKLLEHKDEIIRIQKDSIEMTQSELKDMHERSQKKIDEQVLVINKYLGEKKNLLEQSNLQNQTIKHLQDAVIEAKKGLGRNPSTPKEKSTIDLAVGDVWTSITPAVFNNGDVHDEEFFIEEMCGVEVDIEKIFLENEDLKREVLAYQAILKTIDGGMKNEERQLELETAKKLINALKNKLHVSHKLLKEKSDELAELKADHQMTRNDCLILEAQSRKAGEKKEKETSDLLHRVRQLQKRLCETANDYRRVHQDFEKSQRLLIDAAKREVDLQKSLTEALSSSEKNDVINKLKETINYLRLELREIRRRQNTCYCMNELDFLRRRIEASKDVSAELTKRNASLARLTQEFKLSCEQLKSSRRQKKMKRDKQIFKKFRVGDNASCRLRRRRPIVCWYCKAEDPSTNPFASTIFPKCRSTKTFRMIKSTSRLTVNGKLLQSELRRMK